MTQWVLKMHTANPLLYIAVFIENRSYSNYNANAGIAMKPARASDAKQKAGLNGLFLYLPAAIAVVAIAGLYVISGRTATQSGRYAYVANLNSGNIVIIDTAKNEVTGVLAGFSGGPMGIAFARSGAVYITNLNSAIL